MLIQSDLILNGIVHSLRDV